jgi:glycosyltransferase involved in cell wall biosynthesis
MDLGCSCYGPTDVGRDRVSKTPIPSSRMRILIVSGFFPPYAPIAGVRPGKLAKYLLSTGHDVRVLAAKDLPYPQLLPLEIPEAMVSYADWADVNAWPRQLASFLRSDKGSQRAVDKTGARSVATETDQAKDLGKLQRALRRLSVFYTEATNWPDGQIGWLPYALRCGGDLMNHWRPDLIYATVPPLTGLLVAHRLARRFSVPWLAEFRDLWTDHPYYDAPAWRKWIERKQERAIIRSVSGLVTVSDAWRDLLLRKFQKPTITVLNGFDPEDYPADPPPLESPSPGLRILYTGTLYPGRRDPTPLFNAVAQLGERAAQVRMAFYGADSETVFRLADRAGVRPHVDVHDAVPYDVITNLQRRADVLLLLRWNDPSEFGIVPGKLFEYVGARRPILCLGYGEGAVPQIIEARGLGLVSENPTTIARQLSSWLDSKNRREGIPPLPLTAREGLSRTDQFAQLNDFLPRCLGLK